MISAILIAALIQVESGGNDLALSKRGEMGCLQITQAMVRDVNRIQGHLSFSDADCFDRSRSIAMFRIYIGHYCRSNASAETIARCWNGGPEWQKKPGTDRYWAKVEKELAKQ
jgi:hypothetical protein